MSEDPSVFLRPVKETVDPTRAFDSKKWLWIPDDEEGFKKANLKNTRGEKVLVELTDGQEVEVPLNVTEQMNPPKFEKIEDMAGLTYLNEASVLHNLRQRYYSSLIYTYSGLFCVAVNPYRRLPIYTEQVVGMYKGRRRTEMPPHIFAIADNAYRDMLQDRENQSILITGESGAGKTENTKKVIQYFAHVAPAQADKNKPQQNLEDQVIQANPVLEAFGNAKTVRNDNSSRFGKFIRIHFGNHGKISGGDIEFYLLEKNRVIHQNSNERSFHIFYQLLAGAPQPFLEELLLNRQVKSYSFLSGGTVGVDDVDDSDEFKMTEEAMGILGFTEDERKSLFRTVAGVLHFGNIQVKQRPREEWATIPNTTDAEKVAHILGINSTELVKSLIRPRIKVGNEYVQQGRTEGQVVYSIGALSKALYERMFRWLVGRINKTLDTKNRKSYFIGVLDIAGFEIFQLNSFEQLCINFTNEKLQQFFNHHMFVLEQEEYRKEGIKWEFIDFGLDLQPCIDLIEKHMGILALLDEECLFPKASDKSFVEKLVNNQDGKSANLINPKDKMRKDEPHFIVAHYAGNVDYTVRGWLDKNKDPLNESIVELFKKSAEPLIAHLWSDYTVENERGRGKRGSQFQTVAQIHKLSLNHLMTTLRNTTPHFIRCIIPNELKKAGIIDAHLVMHQLRCNGVLEGIRICRKGFPNRLLYQEFRQRYAILAPKAIPAGFMDGRKASEKLLEALQLDSSEYRLGHSKVFFRAGVLGRLEDLRDERLSIVLGQFQAFCRGYIMRKKYRKLQEQRLAIAVIQRNVRKHLFLRDWRWWRLFTKVKPLLNVARTEDELKQKEDELTKLKERLAKEDTRTKELENQQTELMQDKQQLFMQLQREQEAAADAEEVVQKLTSKKVELENELQELVDRLEDEMENNSNNSAMKRKLELEIEQCKETSEELQQQVDLLEQDKAKKEKDCLALDTELEKVNDTLSKVNKDKAAVEDRLNEVTNSLQAEEDKANRLNKIKIKLESSLQETSDDLEKEKKLHGDVEKAKRKIEIELQNAQSRYADMTKVKEEMEGTISAKEKEVASLQQKVEDNSSDISGLQRKIRELEAKIEELEEDLENERVARRRVEKQRQELMKDLEDLQGQLEEEGGMKTAQIELNRKRESDLDQLRKSQQAQNDEHDKVVSDLRKKHTTAVKDLEEQLENIQKAKSRLEKDKSTLTADQSDMSHQVESLQKAKSSNEKKISQLEELAAETSAKLRDTESALSSLQASHAKAQSENSDIGQQLSEAESKVSTLTKANQQLNGQVEDLKSDLRSETSAKLDALSKLKHAEAEVQNLQDSLEEEQEGKSDVQRQLTTAKSDANQWRSKFESEATPKIEELEDSKRKLHNQIKDLEESLSGVETKCSSLEKTKNRIATELEDVTLDLEKERNAAALLEKKQKKIDTQINEWRQKCEAIEHDLDTSRSEAHTANTQLLNLKNQYEDLQDQMETTTKDNKRLQGDLNDLEKQLSEGGVSAHELEKTKKRLEGEMEELRMSLEEAEGQLEAEEGRVIKLQLELTQFKQESERRMGEKEDETESLRKNHSRQLDALQQSLEEETKAKSEAQRNRKLAEGQVDELQNSLEAAQKSTVDQAKIAKKLQQQIKDLSAQLEEEQRQRDEQHQLAAKAEKRANDMSSELEEIRGSLEQSQRQFKSADAERTEAQDRVNDLQSQKNSLTAAKRKTDQQLSSLQDEYEEMETESKENAEKLRKSLEQNARLQSDFLAQKDQLSSAEKAKSSLESQVKDLTARVDEELASATKVAKRENAKLQHRISEVEGELEVETKGKTDAQRNLRRSDRKAKELLAQVDEEKGNSQRLQDQINSLNIKIRNLKRDKEEVENETETYQRKLRQAKSSLDDAEEQISTLQSQLTKSRSTARSKPKAVPKDEDDDA